MKKLFVIALLAWNFAPPSARAADDSVKPAIILVHGAFADGSGWNKVISVLEKQSFTVTAVQNPLTSLADDIATTRRAIEAQPGPVVLVGHSYGGAVITGVADSSRVKALVYIAAFAPEVGDSLAKLLGSMAPAAIGPALVKDSSGFLHIDREKFREVFAKDVSEKETRLMAATQKPIHSAAFETPVAQAPWKNIPSWYLVATEDNAINPELQKFMAKRIGAKTIEVKASHVPFISHPHEVAKIIAEAASSKGN
jgi:pimeloyl-ACP methyl ester carboxylesterase